MTIRAKLLLLVIFFVVICISSCRKGHIEIKPKQTKTVTVTAQLLDSDSRATVETPYVNSAVIISAVDAYFYNVKSGEIYRKATLSSSEIIQISTESGLTFSTLNSEVNGVAIIANNNDKKDISIDKGRNMYDLLNRPIHIAHEQLFYDVTLYGKNTNLLEIASENPMPNVSYFTTSIKIQPLVARMEISLLECTNMDITGGIQRLRLHSVFIDHTYQLVALDTRKVIDISFFQADASIVETLPSAWWIYSYSSEFPHIPNSNHNESPFSPSVTDPTQPGDGIFAFHFIPSGARPWARLYMISDVSSKVWYLNVKNFTKVGTYAPITFEPGYIYRVKVPFEEEDVTSFDDSLKAITVDVIVQEWTIIDGIVPGKQ